MGWPDPKRDENLTPNLESLLRATVLLQQQIDALYVKLANLLELTDRVQAVEAELAKEDPNEAGH